MEQIKEIEYEVFACCCAVYDPKKFCSLKHYCL